MDLGAVIRANPSALRALSNLANEPSPVVPLLAVKVKVTWRCNLSCIFCSMPEPRSMMARETARSLGRELSAQGLRKVHFSGGEMLTHPECFDILSDWAGFGVQVNLTSNGSLMGKEEIKRLEGGGVHSISLSIDSADRKVHDRLRGKKGSHKAVIRAAERIAARGRMKLRVNTVVTSFNIAGLPGLRDIVRGFGAGVSWKLIPVDPVRTGLLPSPSVLEEMASLIRDWPELEDTTPFGTTPEEFRQISAGRHGFRTGTCYVPWFGLFFTPEGACYPCCMARGQMGPLGVYPLNTLQEIVSGQPMRTFRQLIASGGKHEACTYCDDFLTENRIISDLLSRNKAAV